MKINLNLNETRIKSNKSNACHSIFSFSISPIFTKKTGFTPTFGELQSFNKTFISFCGIKKKESNENSRFKRSIFYCPQERSQYISEDVFLN